MKSKNIKLSKTSVDSRLAFLKRAEQIARERAVQMPTNIDSLSPEEKRLHLHNLHVQQIALELQNEELRRAQINLEQSRERYFELYNLAPVGYCSINEKGLIKEANLTISVMLGIAIDSLNKSPFSRFIFKDDLDIYNQHRKQLFETGAPQNCELRLLKADGMIFWTRIESILIQKEDSSLICRVSISDISKRKEAEQKLISANSELEIKVAERTSELAMVNAQLQNFASRMVRILEDEKKSIARDLHDQIGQTLTALKLIISRASRLANEQTCQTLDEAQVVLSELMGQVREMSLNLRPSMLDDLGLLPALTWHIGRYEKQTKIKVIFNQYGLQRKFSHYVAETVYRVVQEALTNVARHAGVAEVQIDAWAGDSSLTITIVDTGRGFDTVKVASNISFGLHGMSERLLAVGGVLKIDSSPGSGTTITALIPLNGEKE